MTSRNQLLTPKTKLWINGESKQWAISEDRTKEYIRQERKKCSKT